MKVILLLVVVLARCSFLLCDDGLQNSQTIEILLIVSNSTQYNTTNTIKHVHDALVNNSPQVVIDDLVITEESAIISQLYKLGLSKNGSVQYAAIISGVSASLQRAVMAFSGIWNIPVVSYSPLQTPSNSYEAVYLSPSINATVSAIYGLVMEAGWKRITIISLPPDGFFDVKEHWANMLKINSSIELDFVYFRKNLLKEINGTIIFLNLYEESALAILCEAIELKMHYPKYQWILHGWNDSQWFQNYASTNCTLKNLNQTIENAIIIQHNPHETATKVSDYRQSLAYDVAMTLALALDNVTTNEKLKTEHFIDVSFNGQSGFVNFDKQGNRITDCGHYLQLRSDNGVLTEYYFASYDFSSNTFDYSRNESHQTVWPSGIPYDGRIIDKVSVKAFSATVALYSMASMGIIFCIICLVFNIIFRNRKIVRLNSPNLNYFIIIGAVILNASVYIRMARSNNSNFWTVNCHTIIWSLYLGYALCFTPYIAKLARIYYIFHDPAAKKKKIKDVHLILFVCCEICIVLLLLIIGTSIPATRPSLFYADDPEKPFVVIEDGMRIHYLGVNCFSIPSFVWIGISILFFAVQHCFGIYLAIKMRNVKIKVVNESKEVSLTMYISTITMAEGLAISIILQDFDTIVESLVSFAIILVAFIYVGFTFIPKMYFLYKDPQGLKIFSNESYTPADFSREKIRIAYSTTV